MTASDLDLELKKAFTEMQVNKIESTKQLRFIDIKIETLKKSIQRLLITDREISSLDSETKVYASIGRMFSLSTIPVLSDDLKNNQNTMQGLIKAHEDQKQYLMSSLKEKEDSLRELVQQRKDADSK